MKKILLLFALSLIFTGCFHSVSEPVDPLSDRISDIESTATEKEFEGLLEPQNVSLINKATHILKTEEGEELVKVKSSQVFLSSFEGRNVLLRGKLEKLRNGTEILEVETAEIIIDESELGDPEDEKEIIWKTFREPESRYSFEYPEIWKAILARKVLYIKEGELNIIKVTRLDNSKNKSLSDFVSFEYREITVNGKKALRVKKGDGFDLYFNGISEVIKLAVFDDFSEDSQNSDNKKEEQIFQLLNSFSVSEEIIKSQKCGGEENILCAEGFRCEISLGNSGVCKDINQTESYDEFGRGDAVVSSAEVQEEEAVEELEEEEVLNTAGSDKNNSPDLDAFSDIKGDTYINKHMRYQLIYPKHWWYRSFGAQDGNIWHTAFGKKEIENIGEGIIMVDVKHGGRGLYMNELDDVFQMVLVRDSDSHFQISGPIEYKEEIQGMAKSLQRFEE